MTDGPFAETREHLGGYMLIDVRDLDEALAIAARIPLARTSTVEVRPVREGLPSHLFMDMDKMVGGNFEKGPANIKAVVAAAATRSKE